MNNMHCIRYFLLTWLYKPDHVSIFPCFNLKTDWEHSTGLNQRLLYYYKHWSEMYITVLIFVYLRPLTNHRSLSLGQHYYSSKIRCFKFYFVLTWENPPMCHFFNLPNPITLFVYSPFPLSVSIITLSRMWPFKLISVYVSILFSSLSWLIMSVKFKTNSVQEKWWKA